MDTNPVDYKRGSWILLGTAIGAFIGLLFGKFAIGLIFGFFIGVFIDSQKRKTAQGIAQDKRDENKL
jgi:uncharacterized membrane protein YfcA